MSTRDKRKRRHVVISDIAFHDQLMKKAQEEGVPVEKYLKRHLQTSDSPDYDQYVKYQEIEAEFVRRYGKQNLKILMEYFWVYIVNSAKGIFDLDKLLTTIHADIDRGTFEKKGIEKKSLPPPGKESLNEFWEKWKREIS